jgi:hypothetical protein
MAMGKMSETRYPKGDDNSSKPPLERRGADVMSAKVQETDLIGREELREKLDQGDSFKLVMVLGESVYLAKRIPPVVNTPEAGLRALDPDEEIVLYDSGPSCPASRMAYLFLKAHGYLRVRRYAGGLLTSSH